MPSTSLSITDRFMTFVHEHDEVPAFQAGFIVFTFLAAAFFNLGFFLLLIELHVGMDFIKYNVRKRYSMIDSIGCALIESSVDLALFCVALTLVAIFHHSYAVIGLSGVLRAVLTISLAGGMLIPKYRIFQDMEGMVLHLRAQMHNADVRPGILSHGQRIAFAVIYSCFFVMLASAAHINWTSLIDQELILWRL